ncbi:MAG: Unknown protein [uncultured Sulfurovum sp.]|uniref:Thiol-disulfide oxidoreductase n=1 Tax=uncultured Sulfurovum sp. TaxID=269237 RepID=A0A6S6S9D1_9BACT|nr:MAG: Unknown protein [uncultured Sulfurovum sp.]
MTEIETFTNKYKNHNIVLFDGVCNFCEASVNFIIKLDGQKQFHFMVQSCEEAQSFLVEHQLQELDSIILFSNGKVYIHSDAALQIAKKLDGYYKYLYVFRFLPKVFRDWVYKLVAKYRYRIFGKKESCMMPSDELKERFLG